MKRACEVSPFASKVGLRRRLANHLKHAYILGRLAMIAVLTWAP